MTDKSRYKRERTRRDVLSGVATVALLAGCVATQSPETEPPTTAPRTDSPTPTAAASDTETTTPTPSDTETPTSSPTPVTNRSPYPADQPLRIGAKNDSFYRWLGSDDPLISDVNTDVPHKSGAVKPVWSRKGWQRIVTRATEKTDVDPFAYEFVDQTDFKTETVIILQHAVVGEQWLRLLSVDGVGDSHIFIQTEKTDYKIHNSVVYRYIILRVPTDGTEIERVTATVNEEKESTRYVYRDE